jgi:hypothetical protein
MSGRFIAARAVANESSKFDDGKIRDVRIFDHSPDVTAATECSPGMAASEHFGGGGDAFGANRSKAVATKESQFTPPIKASARSQRIGSKNAFNARNARNARILWDFFIGVLWWGN